LARAIWSGNLQVGAINVPVKLNAAVKERTIHFHQINSKTGNRVAQKRVDADSGEEVAYEDIVKGYELSPGQHVTITPEELDSLDPDKTSTVDIESFVDPGELDPVMFDHPYYLAPDKSEKAYALLHEAMKRTGKAAIGRMVMRDKEYVTCIWPHGEALAMTTLHYHDEVLTPEVKVSDIGVDSRHVDMAVTLIESLTEEFDASKYTDDHRERVIGLVQAKADGVVITKKEPVQQAPMGDLLASLEASLAIAKARKEKKAVEVHV
jgi:DNA end-binding protein Ku